LIVDLLYGLFDRVVYVTLDLKLVRIQMAHTYVPMQIFGMHEAFATMFTHERKLFRMLADLMVFEVLFAIEAFIALSALVQRMVHVFGFVLFELVFACKRHLTMIALEWTYVAVSSERMSFQVKRGLKCHATFLTRFELGEIVQCGMFRQVFARLERVSAYFAHEQLQLARVVRGQVVMQRIAAVELNTTRWTRMRSSMLRHIGRERVGQHFLFVFHFV
jgi:hypothetical protein